MTNEDAIKILSSLYSIDVYVNDALDLAIKALEAQQVTVFCETADEETLEDIKKKLQKVLDKLKERNNG